MGFQPKSLEPFGQRPPFSTLSEMKNTVVTVCFKRLSSQIQSHKQVRNNGELPKYLVEDCLPAIVDKETWKLAQAIAARHTPHKQPPNERYPFTGKLICGVCGKPYYYYHYKTTNKQSLAAYRCMSRRTQSAVEVPGQTYTPPHKATFNRNASPELIAYRERYGKPPKTRPMLCTDVRIPIDLPQKAFCRA